MFQEGDVIALRGEPKARRAVVLNVLSDGTLALRGFAGDLPVEPMVAGVFLGWVTPIFGALAADFELVAHRPSNGWGE